jgi:hypothetical protein
MNRRGEQKNIDRLSGFYALTVQTAFCQHMRLQGLKQPHITHMVENFVLWNLYDISNTEFIIRWDYLSQTYRKTVVDRVVFTVF